MECRSRSSRGLRFFPFDWDIRDCVSGCRATSTCIGARATVVHINPVRFDISSQEHFLQGPALMMMKGLFRETFGDFLTS